MAGDDPYRGQEVLVFDAALLDELGRFQGYTTRVEPYLARILDPRHNRYVARVRAEGDESLKQLIPYVILRCGGRVFRYVRGKEAGEARLRAKGSIGIGGHIEQRDETLFASDRDLYRDAAAREVAEEVHVGAPHRERIVGLINDDSNPVGRVHFGVVHLWELERPDVTRRERQITQSGFVELDELAAERDQLETWSQIALDILRQEDA